MTANAFRRMALGLEGAVESAHMGHPDFRAGGRIFATLQYPDERWGMVKLPPTDQDRFVRDYPGVFAPCNGAWGRQGCTNVLLKAVKTDVLRAALEAAWRDAVNSRPKRSKPASGTRGVRWNEKAGLRAGSALSCPNGNALEVQKGDRHEEA
jgi:hypothetical protein